MLCRHGPHGLCCAACTALRAMARRFSSSVAMPNLILCLRLLLRLGHLGLLRHALVRRLRARLHELLRELSLVLSLSLHVVAVRLQLDALSGQGVERVDRHHADQVEAQDEGPLLGSMNLKRSSCCRCCIACATNCSRA